MTEEEKNNIESIEELLFQDPENQRLQYALWFWNSQAAYRIKFV